MSSSNRTVLSIPLQGGEVDAFLFVDPRVAGWRSLTADLPPAIRIIVLDAAIDGVTQIAAALQDARGLAAIHILSHGTEADIHVGVNGLTAENLPGYAAELAMIGASLRPDGDILIYGCEVGSGSKGRDFIEGIADLTGASVAASAGLTGAIDLGGDWHLGVRVGAPTTALFVGQQARNAYAGLLAVKFTSGDNSTFPEPVAGSRAVVGDFDNDGDDDILYQTAGNGTPFEYARSNGDGTFTILPLASSPFAGLTLPDHTGTNYYHADFDGDGDLDLLAAVNGATGSYFRNNGGTFSAQSSATFPSPGAAGRMVAGDFDGDGDADILYQTVGNGTPFAYARSNGDGTFTSLPQSSSPFAGLTLPDNGGGTHFLADFDGDGDEDLWAAVAGANGSYFRNDGGTFVDADESTFPLLATASRIVVADFDSDGDVDILYQVAGNGSAIEYARSNGNGTFTIQSQAASPFAGLSLPNIAGAGFYHPGDFDGDGDIDLIAGVSSAPDSYFVQGGDGDGAPPQLVSSTPADNATGISPTANITLAFSETVNAGAGNIYLRRSSDDALIETISASDGSKISGIGTATVTINPATTLAGLTGYYLTFDLDAFVDTDGVGFGRSNGVVREAITDKTFLNFTTAVPNISPTLGNVNGDTAAFTEEGGAVLLDASGNATVADPDSANFDGGTVTVAITGNRVVGEDVLGIANQGTGPGQIGLSGGNVTFGGVTIGAFTGGSGANDLVVTLDSDATPAAVQALVRALTYNNTNAGNPSTNSRTISIVVTDGDGGASSAATVTVGVTAVDDVHTGGVSISGTAAEDQVLTAVSTLADPDGLGTLHYQWQRDAGSGFVNVGIDQATYGLGDADVGATVRVVVSYTDGGGTAESETSAATAIVSGVNDPHTGGAAITGTTTEDQVLTAVSTLADPDGLGGLHFQWQRNAGSGYVNVGTDQSTYTLGDADVGAIVRVVVSYVDGQGFAESATSAATAAIANVNDPHTGGAAITGTAADDQVLTAVSTLADLDGLGTLHYQWQRDAGSGYVNVGTDQATYGLTDADVGAIVRVVISYTDGGGSPESATSAATAAITDVNDPPTGGVSISGTSTENQVLTADPTTLSDGDGLGVLHYQWQRNTGSGFVNVGTDQATYTLGDADVGGLVRVVVSYIDGQGTAESVTSAATTAISGVNDPHTGSASITGSAVEDQVLTAVSTLADADGLGILHYQWQRDTGSGYVNVGTDQSTYTLGDADVGGIVRVVISYADGQGFAESTTSAATAAIANINDAPTGNVAISGTTTENQLLATVSTLADGDGLGTLHYQWQRDTGSGYVDTGAADQATYTLGDADVGATIRVVVVYTDGGGTAESATSAATAPISGVNDPHTGAASITGTTTEDQVLTAVSTLADVDGLGALHYQWQRDSGSGFANVGADQASYTLGDADVGAIMRVVVSYVDGQGFAESATSATTAAIANINDAPTGNVTITGTVADGQVLTADTAALSDADGLGTLHYQWQRDSGSGFVNVGADQATYGLDDVDVGAIIRVVVSYTDGRGTAQAKTSTATAPVADVNDPHTGGVAISGTATEDQVLTATSTLADPDGLGALHYQWQRDSGSGFTNVGLDQATYGLGDADVGAVVRVVVSYVDGTGTAESATSASTGIIANVNDAPVAANDAASVGQFLSTSGSVRTNDTDVDNPTGSLTVTNVAFNTTHVNQTVVAGGTVVTGAYGHLTIHPDGSYSYSADSGAFPSPGATDIFDYTITDPSGASSTARLTVSVSGSSTGDDNPNIIIGTGQPETLTGRGGDDALYGGGGNDTLDGGDGNDLLAGGAGGDILSGGAGNDTADYSASNAPLNASLLLNMVTGGDATGDQLRSIESITGTAFSDQIFGSAGTNVLSGAGGDDYIFGFTGDDTLNGGAGQDRLVGGSGTNILNGDDGNDQLFGYEGNDLINGGAGNDYLNGGTGRDTFVMRNGTGGDQIADFEAGAGLGDVLDLRDFGFADAAAVLNAAINVNGGVMFVLDADDSVFISGLNKSQFAANDFLLA
ncbi:DUF4347 domain-containing protein [Phreatobacter stygius]|uniref:DUF4347 domain-containing protein n=1 Tax=Phreatobacter stygius TaxID=1940610 RepID=UPI0014768E89|nr:DUF4347 domain-containing protein [Phreatobacter stygius]